MKRIIFILGLIVCSFQLSYAQLETYTITEDFENGPNGFVSSGTSTAPQWSITNNSSISTSNYFRGRLSSVQGDSIVLETPEYDFTDYRFVLLQFDHICKVDPSDTIRLEYMEKMGTAEVWHPVGYEAYLGEAGNYLTEKPFSANSYSQWAVSDIAAIPDNTWWKTERFDMGPDVGNGVTKFRFIIKKGNKSGSYASYGWLIDNFTVTYSNYQVKPPTVEFIPPFPKDTVYSTGPYIINAKVQSNTVAQIKTPYLVYTYTPLRGIALTDSIEMSGTDGITWSATLPQFEIGTSVTYSITGRDMYENTAYAVDSFFIKRYDGEGSFTGYVTIGTGATTVIYAPIYGSATNGTATSKMLYLSTEINPARDGGLIRKVAWYSNSTITAPIPNQKCYMRAVDTNIVLAERFTPEADSAMLVWEGTINNIATGWMEIELTNQFVLPPGKNLLVYWLHEKGSSSGTINWRYSSATNRMSYTSGATYLTDNASRSANRPNVRFFVEGHSDSNSVALTSIVSPTESVTAGQPTPIQVTIKNRGIKNLQKARIEYSVNQIDTFTYYLTSNLSWDFDTIVEIGQYIPSLGKHDTIEVWVSMPNDSVDTFTDDDFVSIITYGCAELNLSGDYIIGNSPSANFASWKDFVFAMQTCGVGGDITAKFEAGNYGQINMTNLGNITNGHALRITSYDQDRDSVRFSVVSTNPRMDTVIIIDNMRNLTIDAVTIDASKNRFGVYFGAASNIVITNCNVFGKDTTADTWNAIHKPHNSKLLIDLTVKHNTIKGGYIGVNIVGHADYKNLYVYIDSNIIENQSYYAVHFAHTNSSSISYNKITESTEAHTSTTQWRGMNLNLTEDITLVGNHISADNPAKTGVTSGIHLITGSNALIANNEIFINYHGGSQLNGIHIQSAGGSQVLHNSVLLKGTGTIFRAFSFGIGSATVNMTVKNNIFIADGGSTAVVLSSGTTDRLQYFTPHLMVFDYNAYYSSSNFASVGYATYDPFPWDRERKTYADWQTLATTDKNSIIAYPNFANPAQNLQLADYGHLYCPMLSNIINDIDANPRVALTTMGCYTYAPVQNNARLVKILDWKESASVNESSSLQVVVQNVGTDNLSNAAINWKLHNGTVQTASLQKTLAFGEMDTVSLGVINYVGGVNELVVYLNGVDGIHVDDTLRASNLVCDPMQGTYIIGPSTSSPFKTFKEALAKIEECSIGGPVVFKFEDGTYLMNDTIKRLLPGSSSVNTITLTSLSGDSSKVILQRADNDPSINQAPLALINTQNIIISNLTLSGVCVTPSKDYTHSHGIIITLGCENITIENCHIQAAYKNGTAASTGTNLCPVWIFDDFGYISLSKNIRITNNLIEGGSTGIYVVGDGASQYVDSVYIKRNTVLSDNYGIYFSYANAINVKNNIVQQSQRNGVVLTDFRGIYASSVYSGNIVANKVRGQQLYAGIYASTFGRVSDTAIIVNNEIIGNVSSTNSGIYINSAYANIWHNSVYVGGSTAIRGINVGGGSYLSIQNNIFVTRSTVADYPIYLGNPNLTTVLPNWIINNNSYYSQNGTYVGFIGSTAAGPKRTMEGWKDTVKTDVGSVNISPSFNNPSMDLNLGDTINLSCPILSAVPTDIIGNQRGRNTNMGAYQYLGNAIDAMVVQIIAPEEITFAETSSLKVIIRNTGSNILNSVMIGYQLNGTYGTSFAWSGNLLPFENSDTITITTNFTPALFDNALKVFTYSPNGLQDEGTSNDTLSFTFFACDNSPLAGTYDVGQGEYFQTLSDVINSLYCKGISAPVEFRISGDYNESISMTGLVPGSSNINTITFTSATQDTSTVHIANPDVIQLENTGFVRFKYLSLSGITTAVTMQGNIKDVEFSNCNIHVNNTQTSTSYKVIFYNGTSSSTGIVDDLRIINNYLYGGADGICINYAGTYKSGDNGANFGYITIDSNTIVDAYSNGIYGNYYVKYKSISYNTIRMRSGSTIAQYGLRLTMNTVIDGIYANKISAYNYGIYISYLQSSIYGVTDKALIANNEIYTSNYGLDLGYNNAYVYNNSVLAKGTAALYGVNYRATDKDHKSIIKNNIFVTIPTGTLNNGYPIYSPGYSESTSRTSGNTYLGTYCESDYNCYYSSKENIVGGYTLYEGTNGPETMQIDHLEDLQPVTKGDRNSVNVIPDFRDTTINLELASISVLSSPVLPSVSMDVTGANRKSPTNMGAYNALLQNIDAALVGFQGFRATGANVSAPISVIIQNLGLDPLQSATITGELNDIPFSPISYNPAVALSYGQKDTFSIGNHTFDMGENVLSAVITVVGDMQNENDTITVSGNYCTNSIGGDIIIGTSPLADYPSWTAFRDTMINCGISSDVVLKYESGIYPDIFDLTNFADYTGIYSITITSLENNKDSVIFKGGQNDTLVIFNKTNNITFDAVTFDGTANKTVVFFKGGANDITILNSNLWIDTTTTSTDTRVIYLPATLLDRVSGFTIKNNFIRGGYAGIKLDGDRVNTCPDIVIEDNLITHQSYAGIFMAGFVGENPVRIAHNHIISRDTNQGTRWYGMYIEWGGHYDIFANRIYSDNEKISYLYGIVTNLLSEAPVAIINNEIYLTGGSSVYGIMKGGENMQVDIYHNTVYAKSTATSGTAQGINYPAVSGSTGSIRNNILVVEGRSASVFFLGTSAVYIANLDIDNNSMYSNTGEIGTASGLSAMSIEEWQEVVPSDVSSITIRPVFTLLNNQLQLANPLDFYTNRLSEVLDDINGDPRYETTLLGAYEAYHPQLDAALMEFVPAILTPNQLADIDVILANMGQDTLTKAIIYWNFNGINGSYLWQGTLAMRESQTVRIGVANIISGDNAFKAWVSAPNDGIDLNNANDTIYGTPYACDDMLAGDYIIGTSANANYATMEDAVYILTTCGIKGPVTFYFESDTFYQNVSISAIRGSSEINTITFTSQSGNFADVVLQRSDSSATRTAPVILENTANIIFKHLSFSGYYPHYVVKDIYSYSYGIIINRGNNIEIDSCYLTVPDSTSSTTSNENQNPVRLTDDVSNIRILNSIIRGGHYGINIVGTSALQAYNILIRNNAIHTINFRGINAKYTDSITIENNVIRQRETTTSQDFYGISMDNAIVKNITANKIRANRLYTGIYLNVVNYQTGITPALIVNNEIIGLNESTTGDGGIHLYRTNANILHNSIAVRSPRAIYGNNYDATSIRGSIRNNNIAVYSTSTNYAFYFTTRSTSNLSNVDINSNNYYGLNSSGIGNFNGTVITTMTDWTTSVPTDTNSVIVSPTFVDVNSNLNLTDFSGLDCRQNPLVLTDIDGFSREKITVMGAYAGVELVDVPNLALTEILEPTNSTFLCAPEEVSVRYALMNMGTEIWDFVINPVDLYLEVGGVDLPSFDTVVTVNTGQLKPLEVVDINLMDNLNVFFAGVYNIKAWLSSSIDTIHKKDTLYTIYSSNKIALPFNEIFDTPALAGFEMESIETSSFWEVTQSDTIIEPDYSDGKLIFMAPRGNWGRLYTHQVELNRTSQPKLEFWYAHDNMNPDFEDRLSVNVTFDGGSTYKSIMYIERYDATYTTPTWVRYEIDLSPYTDSSCVIFAFEAMSGGGIQQIDRIAITSGQNLALEAILVPDYSVCDLSNKELKVVLSNEVNQGVDFVETPKNIIFQIRGDITKDTTIILSKALDGLEKDTILIYPDFDFNKGNYQIKAFLDADVFDFNRQDDTVSRTITITPEFDIEIAKLSINEPATAGFENKQKITIKNTGNMELSSIGLILTITSDEGTYTFNTRDTFNQALQPNGDADFTFNQAYTVPWSRNYDVKVHGYLMCDSMLFNKDFSVQENVDMVDLALVTIEEPADDGAIDIIGSSMEVIVNIQNLSPGKSYTSGEAKAGIILTDTNGNPVASLPVEGLPFIGSAITNTASITYPFNGKYTVPNLKEYYLVVYIDGTDQYNRNDTLKLRRTTNAVGTNDLSKVSFTMEQNIPNPAKGNTIINYNVPQDGEVTFQVYAVSGQLLYNQKEHATVGNNRIELNISDYASGVYFYTMEYKGQRLTKRMSIKR